MQFKLKPAPLVGAILLTVAAMATAAGIDCGRARSPSELAICGSTELVSLDARVARLYANTRRVAGVAASQKQWLHNTTACAANVACLKSAYAQRIPALREIAKSIAAYQPDAVDQRALAELRQAVEQALKSDGEMGLAKALDALAFKQGLTEFGNERQNERSTEDPRFPAHRPEGVTPDEWLALKRSNVEAEGENGTASYTLLDLDGDGLRDLAVDVYSGGTGLWNYVTVFRRQGDRFISRLPTVIGDPEFSGDDALYSLNGRGANQSAYWVKLQGRMYVAYFEGAYGVDSVSLLQPLRLNGNTPTLTVRYAYALSIPRKQARGPEAGGSGPKITLSAAQHGALTKGLAAFANPSPTRRSAGVRYLCPVPPNTSEDDKGTYTSFGPGHYSYEDVVDFPVWYGKECRIARLVDWFGSYGPKGLSADLWVRKADGSGEQESFSVIGRRRVIGISSGLQAPPSHN